MQTTVKKDSNEIVVIKYFYSEMEAHIAAGLLRDNGIECSVDGSLLVNITIFPGAFQLSLSVLAKDESRAKELLQIE